MFYVSVTAEARKGLRVRTQPGLLLMSSVVNRLPVLCEQHRPYQGQAAIKEDSDEARRLSPVESHSLAVTN